MVSLSRKEKSGIAIWAIILIAFYVIATAFAAMIVQNDIADSKKRQSDRLNPFIQESGYIETDSDMPSQENADSVKAGLYVDHIVDFSTKNTNWTVDFYIWFNWKNKDLQPGRTFQVINGEILSRQLVDSTYHENKYYVLYRVVTQITKFFDITRYPRDNHLLTISIEDSKHQWQNLKYIPEINTSDISSRVKLPGYKVTGDSMVSKPHPYRTNRGNPRLTAGSKIYYNQLIYGLSISRPNWGLYYKMFESLFASVAIALLVFFMNPQGDGRVSLGIGAFFAAVASSYITSSELPGIGILTLSDLVNILGMVTIFLSVLCSIIVMKIAENEEQLRLAKIFDKLSLVIFLIGYITANVVLAQFASI